MKKSISLLAMPSWINIGQILKKIESFATDEIDSLHIDVMDGHFAPNIAFGPELAKDISKHTALPLDFHLMIDCFPAMLGTYKKIKHRKLYIPIETHLIKSKHVSLNIHSSLELIKPYLEFIETVLIMTVKNGFSGQTFNPEPLNKTIMLKKLKPSLEIWVDGGVNQNTLEIIKQFPVDGVVMGKGFFETFS